MKRYLSVTMILVISMTLSPEIAFSVNSGYNRAGITGSGKCKEKLFNGRNLDGWYTFIRGRGKNNDPKHVFSVSDGKIRISGEEYGCITTVQEYENYSIVAEFKWGEATHSPRTDKARDSGLLLHSVGEDGGSDGTWMHSIECQIIEGGTGDFIVVGDGSTDYSVTCTVAGEKQGGSYIYDPSGTTVTINSGRINWVGRDPEWEDTKGFRGARDAEKPAGRWNKLKCVVKGSEIYIYLNGKLVNHATNVKPQKGKIQIQSEGAEILFRRIDLTRL
jgi:hypothetical protein